MILQTLPDIEENRPSGLPVGSTPRVQDPPRLPCVMLEGEAGTTTSKISYT